MLSALPGPVATEKATRGKRTKWDPAGDAAEAGNRLRGVARQDATPN